MVAVCYGFSAVAIAMSFFLNDTTKNWLPFLMWPTVGMYDAGLTTQVLSSKFVFFVFHG